MTKKNPRAGSKLESLLKDEGWLEEFREVAIKEVIAWQLGEAMAKGQISKTAMAKRLSTSRSQLDRLLDPKQEGVTLATLAKAARAVGKRLHIDLVDAA